MNKINSTWVLDYYNATTITTIKTDKFYKLYNGSNESLKWIAHTNIPKNNKKHKNNSISTSKADALHSKRQARKRLTTTAIQNTKQSKESQEGNAAIQLKSKSKLSSQRSSILQGLQRKLKYK